MKRSRVVVLWTEGLHLRPAARLVRMAQSFQSSIVLSFGGRIADLRSILNVIALCATMGAALDVEATGEDEENAIEAVQQMFSSGDFVDSAGIVAERKAAGVRRRE